MRIMSASAAYTVKVEEGRPATEEKPAAGPVYRCIYAKDGLLELPAGMESPWQFFRYIYIYKISLGESHAPSPFGTNIMS